MRLAKLRLGIRSIGWPVGESNSNDAERTRKKFAWIFTQVCVARHVVHAAVVLAGQPCIKLRPVFFWDRRGANPNAAKAELGSKLFDQLTRVCVIRQNVRAR